MSKLLRILGLLILASCSFQKTEKEVLLINGAGASFPYILYSKWFSEYNKLYPQVTINYQSIGSGGGVRQFINNTLDFGATDVPVLKKELKKSKKSLIHIPTTLGAVAITYNLKIPQHQTLKMDGRTLALIFLGEIKKWNHPSIQRLNPKVSFPDTNILPIYRADGSGTTAIFTEYLAQTKTDFLNKTGKGKLVNWLSGIGGKGNEGVVGLVNKMEGSLAYISLSYALVRKLPVAKVKNPRNEFISPSKESIKKAASSVMKDKKSYLSSLVNAKEKGSYPISSFTYFLLSKKMPQEKGSILIRFIKWALKDGQTFAYPLHFIPLPLNVITQAKKNLSTIQFE